MCCCWRVDYFDVLVGFRLFGLLCISFLMRVVFVLRFVVVLIN